MLGAPSIPHLLETLLAVRPGRRIFLTPGLLPSWGRRIEDGGGRAVPLEGPAPLGLPSLRSILAGGAAGDQVWLDLGDPAALAETAEAFLDLAFPGLDVVLLRDDHPLRARTQRLAVDHPGRVVLLREAAGSAYALGRPELLAPLAAAAPWPARAPGTPPAGAGALLVLDVDGVLIDPGRAFMEAVAGALADLAPGLAWGDAQYQALKGAGGFNNDFRLAAAALALAERGQAPGRDALDGLQARIADLEPRCAQAVRRHYARTRQLERPLVTRERLAAVSGDLALFTGRPPEELAMAFQVLGFTLPALADSAPHLRKPRPEGLVQLADAFRAGRITFVGDSRDDAAALRGARALRPDLDWRFAAVGPGRARFAREGDLRAGSLTDLLESGELE